MKSVWRSGRKARWVCVPSIQPLPITPPEPIAIVDWMMWKPLPSGSRVGSSRVHTRCFWYSRSTCQSTSGWHRVSPKATIEPSPITTTSTSGMISFHDRPAK